MNNLDDIFEMFSNDNIDLEIFDKSISPYFYKLNMFLRLSHNGHSFKSNIVKLFAASNQELDSKNVSDAGEFLINYRAWNWIKDFEDNEEWASSIKEFPKKIELLKYINKSLNYFESLEEYEKCTILFKIKTYLKESLDS